MDNFVNPVTHFIIDNSVMEFELQVSKLTRSHSVEAEQKRLIYKLNNMARQEARRINPRNFPCDQCDRAYTTNQKLKFHKIAEHEGGSPRFPCPECDKVMRNPGTLQVDSLYVSTLSMSLNVINV